MKNKGAAGQSPRAIYRALIDRFGAQGWWPVTPCGGLVPQYTPRVYRRMKPREQFEVCIGAFLTQNTAWKNVEKALTELNRHKLIDPVRLKSIPHATLAAIIRASGYYNQKAQRIKGFSKYLIRHYRGKIGAFLSRDTDVVRRELLSLNGVGHETADSILLYAAQKPVMVIDSYTRRIGSRLGWFKHNEPYEILQQFFLKRLPKSVICLNEFHALLVELAKQYCRKIPQCEKCVIKKRCWYVLH